MSFRTPVSTSFGADADYRDVRERMAGKNLEYAMYAPRPAICPETLPATCHWPEARSNLWARDEVGTRARGAGKFDGGLMNPTKFQFGNGQMRDSGVSARLRQGAVVRGTLPRPTTTLVGKGKFQYGKGLLAKTAQEDLLQNGATTVRRGTARPSIPLVGPSTFGLGRTPGGIGQQTAVRARNKYDMSIAQLMINDRPIVDKVVVEEFPRGGLITREGCGDIVYAGAVGGGY